MFEQKFGFSVVVFVHMWQFHSDFYCFFRFFESDFFLNSFPNPFTAHSGPSFLLESQITYLTSGFLFSLAAF